MWELSRGYRDEETQPTRSLASRSNVRSSASQQEAVSWSKKEKKGKIKRGEMLMCRHTCGDGVWRN